MTGLKKMVVAALAAFGLAAVGVVAAVPSASAGTPTPSAWACPYREAICYYLEPNGWGAWDWWTGGTANVGIAFEDKISSVDNWSHDYYYCLWEKRSYTGAMMVVAQYDRILDLGKYPFGLFNNWGNIVSSVNVHC